MHVCECTYVVCSCCWCWSIKLWSIATSQGNTGLHCHCSRWLATPIICVLLAPPTAPDDPSLPVLTLIRLLFFLNHHWTDLYQVGQMGGADCMYNTSQPQGIAASPIVPQIEFINQKLSAKAMRQLQGTLCGMVWYGSCALNQIPLL